MTTDDGEIQATHQEERGFSADFQYPDSGEMLEDAAVLRNAITFTVVQRAFVADSLLHQPFERMTEMVRGFITLEAFASEMTATEDILGWLFALREWQPGTAANSLMANLDSIQVGRGSYDEKSAQEYLTSLGIPEFRKVLHIPERDALAKAGMDESFLVAIEEGLPHKLSGLQRAVELRGEQDRTRVDAFNKFKHMLMAFPSRPTDSEYPQVELIKGRFKDTEIHLNSVTLEVSAGTVHKMAGNALAMQVTLWDTLALISWLRFDDKHEPPPWVLHAMDHGNWREG